MRTLFILLIFSLAVPSFAQSLFDSQNQVVAQRTKGKKATKAVEEEVEEGEESEEGEEGAVQEEQTSSTLQRGNRMEFDARLIRGETAGSGAVFLFQRAPRALPSMVKTRTSYLSETVQDVLGDQGTKEFEETKIKVTKEIEKEGKAK